MKLYYECVLKDEETDEVIARVGSYSLEGMEEKLYKLERQAKEALRERDVVLN